MVRLALDKLDEALADAAAAEQLWPACNTCLRTRGWVSLKRGDPAKALEQLDTVLKRDPTDRSALVGRCLGASKVPLSARVVIEACTQSVQALPSSTGALEARADAYLELDELELAARDYDAVLAIAPQHLGARVGRAWVKVLQRRPLEARRLAREILADHPDDVGALAVEGEAAVSLGDLRAAAAAYRKALSLAPADWGYRDRAALVADAGR